MHDPEAASPVVADRTAHPPRRSLADERAAVAEGAALQRIRAPTAGSDELASPGRPVKSPLSSVLLRVAWALFALHRRSAPLAGLAGRIASRGKPAARGARAASAVFARLIHVVGREVGVFGPLYIAWRSQSLFWLLPTLAGSALPLCAVPSHAVPSIPTVANTPRSIALSCCLDVVPAALDFASHVDLFQPPISPPLLQDAPPLRAQTLGTSGAHRNTSALIEWCRGELDLIGGGMLLRGNCTVFKRLWRSCSGSTPPLQFCSHAERSAHSDR